MDGVPQLNVVVMGGEDAGKSTLVGHLMVKTESADNGPSLQSDRVLKGEKDLSDTASQHTQFALLLYRRKLERQQGRTLCPSVRHLRSHRFNITLTDTPGHRQGVRCLGRAIAGQDAALLVVDASQGLAGLRLSLDAGQGLLWEHMLAAVGLGVRQFVVALNKMDAVGHDEKQFRQQEAEVRKALRRAGLAEKAAAAVPVVPVAGGPGDNLADHSGHMTWYEKLQGPTLLQALDQCRSSQQAAQQPVPLATKLLMPVQEVMMVSGIGPVCVGRVEAGSVSPGQEVVLLPRGIKAQVKSVEQQCHVVEEAQRGACVGVALRGLTRKQLCAGWVICDAQKVPHLAVRFTARIMVRRGDLFGKHWLDGRMAHGNDGNGEAADADSSSVAGMRASPDKGYCPVLDMHAGRVQCRLVQVLALLDKQTGKPMPGPPPSVLHKGDAAEVEFAPLWPAFVMTRAESAAMGVFLIREKQYVVGYGGVTSITKTTPCPVGGTRQGGILAGISSSRAERKQHVANARRRARDAAITELQSL
ncbi:P-loop containing nucleoside triphosphate hydrolase protein [Haematococcus lacustris]